MHPKRGYSGQAIRIIRDSMFHNQHDAFEARSPMKEEPKCNWRAVSALLIGSCVTIIGFAQGPPPDAPPPIGDPPFMEDQGPMLSRPKPEKELKQLDKRLKLSGDQRGQILPLLKDRADAISELVVNSDLSTREKLVQIASVRDTSNAKIRGLLTDTQKQLFDKMLVHERKYDPADFGPGDLPGGPPPGEAPPPPPQ